MPKHRQPRLDCEKVEFEQRDARIKHHVNLAFEATNLSKRDFTRLCFPSSCDIESASKNIFNWLRTGQISKHMLVTVARAADVPVEFLLGEENKWTVMELDARLRRKLNAT